MKVLLVSTYELSRQPFGLASPAAWLRREGHQVVCVDHAVQPLTPEIARDADLIGFYVPMHAATRLAVALLKEIQTVNPQAHICFYGLYAPLNAAYLRRMGVQTILGGEFEEGLVSLCRRVRQSGNRNAWKENLAGQVEPPVSLNRQRFIQPDRRGLPPLSRYARLLSEGALPKTTAYVEASRGCKHLCRHCPVVPVYRGRFRIIQREVVLADIRQQIEAGAEHITFGDPDFLNGPGHTIPLVQELHRLFPGITYDVTIKIEHLLKHREYLPLFRETGCAFITSAVEAIDNRILEIFDKGHTREDFIRVTKLFRETGLVLNPTFVAFNPWISLEGYRDLLALISRQGLVANVAPVQLAIRLLIPQGSALLALPGTREVIEYFDEEMLSYRWRHPDPRVDELYQKVREIVSRGIAAGASRRQIFQNTWHAVTQLLGEAASLPESPDIPQRSTIPYLNEPWYC